MIAYLEILPSKKRINLNQKQIKIGRSPHNDIIIKNKIISKSHCHIFFLNEQYLIEDLGSKNGTFVNGEKIKEKKILNNHDIITFGISKPVFRFICYEEEIYDNGNTKIIKTLIKVKKIKQVFFNILLTLFFLFSFLFIRYSLMEKTLTKKDIDTYKKYQSVMNKFGEVAIMDPKLIKKIEYYIEHYRKDPSYKIAMERRKEYIKMIEEIFLKYKIPVELSYLALIESHYDPYSYNKFSGAKGLWQLLPSTARQYGLTVNHYLDERLDPVKSTEATAKYFHNLISTFGIHSITLVIAAFNAGENKIIYALKKIEDPVSDRNFWFLYKKNLIPDETKEYVIKAISLIILDAEKGK